MSSYYNLFKYTVYGVTFGYHALTYYKYLEYSYQFYSLFRWLYEKKLEKEPLKLQDMSKSRKKEKLEETHKIDIS